MHGAAPLIKLTSYVSTADTSYAHGKIYQRVFAQFEGVIALA